MGTVLVSGGAGFIGSNLCEHLLKQGHAVVCLDNFYTGRRENIEHLMQNPNFSVIEQDVVEFAAVEQVDQIYHLACPASPPKYQKDPLLTIRTCVGGTVMMLELAKKHNVPILFTSTSEVYGDPLEHPQKESYLGNVNCTGKRACYDEGKRIAETLCFEYHRLFDVQIRVARIFNTYGPRMDPKDGRVVGAFITQALANEELTVFGDGTQTRSFCYVDDMVRGLVALMESRVAGPVNLGNPNEKSVLELAKTVVALTDSASQVGFRELPEDDPVRRQPDITKAKSELNWQPQVHLEEGLKATISYFKAQN